MWDYPRPPRLEPVTARLRVVHRGATLADTTAGHRVIETSQAPTFYFPPDDVDRSLLARTTSTSFCEWKGLATYWTAVVEGLTTPDVAWSYESPTPAFTSITGHFAFYARRVDECWVGDERATPMPGGFYGGWITSSVVGPFKGGPGTAHW